MAKGAALYEVLGEVAKSGGSSTATSATDLPGLLPAGQVFVCPEESLFYSQAVEKLVLSMCEATMRQFDNASAVSLYAVHCKTLLQLECRAAYLPVTQSCPETCALRSERECTQRHAEQISPR
jgi:hypothetical protein